MIQRIQTIYLLIVTGVLITAMCLPLGTVTDLSSNAIEIFKPLGFMVGDAFQSTWALFSILLIAAVIDFVAIFFFKNRMLQIRMAIFSICLLAGYYLTFLAFYFMLLGDLFLYNVHWALCLPLIGIIINYLAIRAIGADEAKIQSLNRLR